MKPTVFMLLFHLEWTAHKIIGMDNNLHFYFLIKYKDMCGSK